MIARFNRKRYFGVSILLTFILMLPILVGKVEAQQKYPTRAIDVLNPFSAGGATDLAARLTADYCKKEWGVPVNVINKPGGNTILANLEVYKAPPDGYTMLSDSRNSASLLPIAVKEVPFNVMDRTFVAMTTTSPHIFVVNASSPYKTLADIVAEVKKDPKNFTWSSIGGTSTQEYMVRQFFKAIGVNIKDTKPVVTQGGGEVAALVAGNHVKLGVVSSSAGLPLIQGGTARALMISSGERDPSYPNVPTRIEAGYPTVDVVLWMGISGPPKLPSYIVDIWNKTIQKMVKDPDFIARVRKMGLTIDYKGPDEMREFVRKEIKEIAELLGS